MHRKGYFLTIDAFIAIGIIVAGIVIVLSQYSFKPYEPQYTFYSQDIMNSLSNTRIYQVNDDGTVYLNTYKEQKNITNLDNTLFEQIAEFWLRTDHGCSDKCREMAKNLTLEMTNSSLATQYSFNITISNSSDTFILYNRTYVNPLTGDRNRVENSPYVTSSKGIISAVYEGNLAVYTTEVVVWQ